MLCCKSCGLRNSKVPALWLYLLTGFWRDVSLSWDSWLGPQGGEFPLLAEQSAGSPGAVQRRQCCETTRPGAVTLCLNGLQKCRACWSEPTKHCMGTRARPQQSFQWQISSWLSKPRSCAPLWRRQSTHSRASRGSWEQPGCSGEGCST